LHREAGLEFPSSEIIYGGVPVKQFYNPIDLSRNESAALRILYVGQISPDRGLHTLVEAIGQIKPRFRPYLSLSIAGDNSSKSFAQVKARIEESGIKSCVSYLGKVQHDEMPRIYRSHDVLVFPSTRPEGLPLTMIEAMLAGCAVLTTGSGGAMEIANLATLPLFPKDDHITLSRLLEELLRNRSKVYKIALRGQQVALREFNFDRMMDQWKGTLQQVFENKRDSN
jgi:glycogen synthase